MKVGEGECMAPGCANTALVLGGQHHLCDICEGKHRLRLATARVRARRSLGADRDLYDSDDIDALLILCEATVATWDRMEKPEGAAP